MSTKAEYEEKKAARKAHREKIAQMQAHSSERDEAEKEMFLDLLDRAVTAIERIADGLEKPVVTNTPEYAKPEYRGLGD